MEYFIYPRGFNSLATALDWASHLTDSDIKVKNFSNSNITESNILAAVNLCKVLYTLVNKRNEFLKLYKIKLESKCLWDNTTWRFSYDRTNFLYTVKSGCFIHDSDFLNIFIPQGLDSQINKLINEISHSWPSQRFKDLYKRLNEISDMT